MSPYNQLKNIFHDAALSSDIAGILHWDMSTMMPSNSRKQRAEQLAYLSKLSHDKICLLYTSPSPRDPKTSRMPSSA